MEASPRQEIRTFLVLTLALSCGFYYLIIAAGTLRAHGGLYVYGLMWSPGVAAMLTRLAHRRSLRGLGWRLGPARYWALSYALPVAYAAVAYGGVWAAGWGRFQPAAWPRHLALFATLGLLQSCLSALGEEIGWRGLLVPQLTRVVGYPRACWVAGLLWATWHYPILLFADYNSGTPPLYGLACFTVMIVGISFAFNWIRLRSGSLWTGMVLHASHNLYIQNFFDPLTADTGPTEYIIGEFGAALAVVTAGVGYLFWRLRHRLSAPVPAETSVSIGAELVGHS